MAERKRELIARNGEIVAKPGRGQLLKRQPPPSRDSSR